MARHISSFALQYGNVSASALLSSSYDLIITEGDPLPSGTAHPAISPTNVAALQAQGRTVVGYINAAVTDDNRSYWNAAWTTDGSDTGALTASAPAWLKGQPKNEFGYIVKYWDSNWQNIVINQAVDLVQHGYDGVFIDDMGRYYDLIGQPGEPNEHQLADRMINFLGAIRTAIKAVNPNAYVVINGDPYIGSYATGGLEGSKAHKFVTTFDKMLLENQGNQTLADAITNIGAAKLIALFSVGSDAAKIAAVMHAYQLGVAAYAAPDEGYDSLGGYVNPGTDSADTLIGGDGPNMLKGLTGDDTISGGAGNDVLNGGAGSDRLDGGTGTDRFVYAKASESTGVHFDTVVNFDAAVDRFDLTITVTGMNAKVTHGALSDNHFGADLNAAAVSLTSNHALVFTPDSGDHAGQTFLIVDLNGTAGYQSGADLLLRLESLHHPGSLGSAVFV